MKDWAAWMKIEDPRERTIHMFQAETDQLRIEDGKNCRLIYVRDIIVGAVDFKTRVRLRLSSETSPALVFNRVGTDVYVFAYLHKWEH